MKRVRLSQQQLSWFFIVAAVALGTLGGLFVLSVTTPVKILGTILGLFLVTALFVRLEYGLLALVSLTYVNFYDVAVRNGLPSVAPILIILLIGTILFHVLFKNESPRAWVRPSLLMLSFGITGLISFAFARDLSRTTTVFFDFILAATLGSLVVVLLQNGKFLRHVIWVLILAGLFMGGISVYQYFTNSWGQNFGGFGRAEISQITSSATVFRISGPIGDANFYAQILVVLVPFGLERFWHEKSKLLRLLAIGAAAITSLAIFLTFSRGGFLALLLVMLLTFLWIRPKFKYILFALILIAPLALFIPKVYFERIGTITELIPSSTDERLSDRAFRGRASEWKAAIMMFEDHPFLGVGLGNYPVHYQQYSRDIGLDSRLSQRSAHSLYLQIAAETGVVGLSLMVLILFIATRGILTARKRMIAAGLHEPARLSSGFLIGFVGYLIAGIFLHPAYPNFLWLLIGIALSIPIIAGNELIIREAQLEFKTSNS